MASIESAISKIDGIVGVAAKHLPSEKEIRINDEELFFTASTLKVPLLVELYRQVDQGKVDPNRRVSFSSDMRVPGSGVLKELGAGIQPTIHDLALLMIIISDNTATDILYNMVGGDTLNATMKELGLTKTRIPMATRELLFSLVGMDSSEPQHTFNMASDKLFLQQYVEDSDALSEEHSDVSSPSDMIRLLEMVQEGSILSPSSREAVLDILRRQQLNTVIPHSLPTGTESAHKTGSYRTVRCDVGIVYSHGGPYTVAIMAKRIKGDTLENDLKLAAVSKAIFDEFN